jgi:hypothetical protein
LAGAPAHTISIGEPSVVSAPRHRPRSCHPRSAWADGQFQCSLRLQIKRIHEYKRQLLNLLETVALYDAFRADPADDWVLRVKILAGKADADYTVAELIVKLAKERRDAYRSEVSQAGGSTPFWAADHGRSVSKMACATTPVRRPRTCIQNF